MNDDPEQELEKAVGELEAVARAKGRGPGRWEARAVLVPLGRLILARGEEALAASVARIRAAGGLRKEAWDAALREELALACAEHVQGTDPRYLTLPNFDWEYVLSARERLEARAVAARALRAGPADALWSQVLDADARVRAHAPASRRASGAPGRDPEERA